jgi:hypothetical protein
LNVIRVCFLTMSLIGSAVVASAATPAELIQTIKGVGKEGAQHAEVVRAVRELSKSDAKVLPELLKSFDGASPLAANWLRGAFETIADRAVRDKQLPAKALETFALDTARHPAARRMAFEWLSKVDPTAADRLIPGLLQDPSPEFRRDAVARVIESAQKLQESEAKDAAIAAYKTALAGAVDDDQVKAVVKPLRELGQSVDLQQHFGFLATWRLIGPFDSTENKGYDIAYPPEQKVDFAAKYAGKMGEVEWQEYRTEDEYGIVDLAKATAPHKGAVTYAATEFDSPADRTVDIRLGTPNAWKLWVNGKLIFARDEYHRGMQIDQYKVQAQLQRGRNVILLKVCQNEQKEEWAQRWQYQVRVCDGAGAAVLPVTKTTAAEGKDQAPKTKRQ